MEVGLPQKAVGGSSPWSSPQLALATYPTGQSSPRLLGSVIQRLGALGKPDPTLHSVAFHLKSGGQRQREQGVVKAFKKKGLCLDTVHP